MKIITFNDILSLKIPINICYEWSELVIHSKNDFILPPKISIKHPEGGFCNVMPCCFPKYGDYIPEGLKMITRHPNNLPSLEGHILLSDASTGKILAFMDGTWITAMRTGAAAAHSIKLLARKDFSKICIMGLGNVSRSTLLMLLYLYPDRDFHIKLLKYKDQESSFMKRFSAYANLEFTCVDSVEDLICGSEVIISGATYLPKDICPDHCFDEGCLLVPIHTLGFTNCDLFFDKVFVDDTEHVRNFRNFNRFKTMGEIHDVVTGSIPGRESDQERILVYNVGIACHDLYYAAKIYDLLQEYNILQTLPDANFTIPSEKFWI